MTPLRRGTIGNIYTAIGYICRMLTPKDVMDMGFAYGEEFDRSQVDKWLRGVNSSKAVRVMLAMMEDRLRKEKLVPELTGNHGPQDGVYRKSVILEDVKHEDEAIVVEEEPDTVMANYKYEAPGAPDGWKWDLGKVQVCYNECVYATKEYVEVGGYVSLEGDLIRLKENGKFELV